jgi:hypothetical protein
MAATTIILIVFFAVAATLILVILAALERLLMIGRTEHRRVETDKIRDQAREETLRLRQHEALASGKSPDGPVPTATVHA